MELRQETGVFGSKQNVGYAVTVYNSGGGNKYYLDGVEAPTLTGLIRGATYTFDQSDSTNGTHPLVFGTTAEGTILMVQQQLVQVQEVLVQQQLLLFHMMDLIQFTITAVLTLGWELISQVLPQMSS